MKKIVWKANNSNLKRKKYKKNKINKLFLYKCLLILVLIFSFFLSKYLHGNLTSTFPQTSINQIKIAFYCNSIKYGGVERVISILLKFLSKEILFKFYLITISGRLSDEYELPGNIMRIFLKYEKINIIQAVEKENIDILIYNFYNRGEIENLNRLNKTKVIYFNHSSYFLWLLFHRQYHIEQSVYQTYKSCKYIISLIPVETDYLFKIWGLKSIFINNPSTYEYDSIIPSNLTQKNIIMIGRAEDSSKRFELGIKIMKSIVQELPDYKMKIISERNYRIESLIKSLNLENNIEMVGYKKNPESYYKNSCLHIFPSLCDTYPTVITEAKIFGIPTVICGLDYLALAKKGTIIVFDDDPDIIAKEAIKILKDDNYRKKLGEEARKSMKSINNKIIAEKWKNILLSVYEGVDQSTFYKKFTDESKKMREEEAITILNNQLNLMKKRNSRYNSVTLEKLKSYSLF